MYQFVYGVFYVLSLLPWRVIYLLSDCIAFLLYYVFKYRKHVVFKNLAIAFPEKTETERTAIAKKFYRGFSDNFLEVIKLISISKEELNSRFSCDYEVINGLYDSGVNVNLLTAHYFNWEFANLAYSANLRYTFVGVYMPISSKVFDRIFYRMRQRFGAELVAATRFRREFLAYARQRFTLALIADQNPGGADNAYWTPFFGRLTPILKGPERTAAMNKGAVVMVNFHPVKRGYYQSKIVLLTTDAATLPQGEITKRMIAFIEESIRAYPASYLWSHRRWKFEFDEDKFGKLVI